MLVTCIFMWKSTFFFLLLRIEPKALSWTKTITDVYFVNVLSAWERQVNEICPLLNRLQFAGNTLRLGKKAILVNAGHTRFSEKGPCDAISGLLFFTSSRDITYGPFQRRVSGLSEPSSAQFLFGVWQSWGSANIPIPGFRVRDPWFQLPKRPAFLKLVWLA